MNKTLRFSLGSLVVRYGKILKVSKVEKDTIYLQPYFKSKVSSGLTFTINLSHANDGHIRPLTSKSKIKGLINSIIKKPSSKLKLPKFNAKTALISNEFISTLWVIKTLWVEKQEKGGTLTGSKTGIFKKAMIQATQEMAIANHTTPEQEAKNIMSKLASTN